MPYAQPADYSTPSTVRILRMFLEVQWISRRDMMDFKLSIWNVLDSLD